MHKKLIELVEELLNSNNHEIKYFVEIQSQNLKEQMQYAKNSILYYACGGQIWIKYNETQKVYTIEAETNGENEERMEYSLGEVGAANKDEAIQRIIDAQNQLRHEIYK